jgi:hypothetical protein
MKAEIEAILKPLLGEPLTDMWRYAGFQRFEFGEQRRSHDSKADAAPVGDWALIAGCAWRITGPMGVVVSSANFGESGRTDKDAAPFYRLLKREPPVVEALEANAAGAIRLQLTAGYLLEIEPEGAEWDDEPPSEEYWLFHPRDKRKIRTILYHDGLFRSRPVRRSKTSAPTS